MVVGQDLGVTLDMENWWIRAKRQGDRAATDLVPMGMDGTLRHLLHHPTGVTTTRAGLGRARRADPGRVAVPRVPPTPGERRADRRLRSLPGAHAAVVEGERAGTSLWNQTRRLSVRCVTRVTTRQA